MCPVQLTDIVSVSYVAQLDSGELVEQAPEDKPVQLQIGSGRILQAVEASLMGMEPGEIRRVRILEEDAYGPHHDSLVQEVPRSTFGENMEPKPGMILSLTYEKDGEKHQIPATVIESDSQKVKVDYNHPLAGKAITYTVKLHAIGN
ncbi:FKBP-type peptidyl-prolyl cis-trans isomerase [Desulfogranum japonicum]|uniref:FKBP-type peptidyl-prolyl cis-trans isomerase n=1 Tax=Desulfogranum japonicum TaxID=231447 RepID=UPI00048BC93E|nr:FKBP-type peptidyl-prolyl cis-trans isomerase [Desulfogranum japonicum]